MLLEVDGLSAGYGSIVVLRDVSFSIETGETVAVIGANGAGKTTLLWALSGMLRPRSGRIVFDGVDITRFDSAKIVKLGMGHVVEGMQVFASLSVEDNLLLGCYGQHPGLRMPASKKVEVVYRYFPVLEKKRKQLAGSLSGGEKQMLAIARILMCDLKMLLLDEPSAGLAPLLVERLFQLLRELRETFSLTTLLVEQNAQMALGFAERGFVLAQGRIVLSGRSSDLANDSEVKRIYLGGGG